MIRKLRLTLAIGLALLLTAPVEAATPWHTNTTIAIAAAGWQNVAIHPTDREGWVSAWSVRASAACTNTGIVPFLTDQVPSSGTATPTGNPPAEYRVAEKTSQVIVASALEPTFATAFTEPMPYVNGLRFWANVTGAGTCTLVVSVWGEK
jgi:hypothetical protein